VKNNPTLAIGAQFTGKPKKVAESRVLAFSGGPLNAPGWPAANIHTNLKFAQSVGLPTRAISATQYQSHLIDMLIDIFGINWFKHGRIDSKFVVPVDVNDIITSKLIVTSIDLEGSAKMVKFDASCENQRGQKVLIGTASCIIAK
jgi:acyl dehydratase